MVGLVAVPFPVFKTVKDMFAPLAPDIVVGQYPVSVIVVADDIVAIVSSAILNIMIALTCITTLCRL